MRNVSVFAKVLAIVGTLLVLFPFLFMIYTSAGALFERQKLLIDYFIPMELFFIDLPGALLLIFVALRTHTLRALTCISAGGAIFFFVACMLYASVSGLASGEVEPTGWIMYLAGFLTALFVLAMPVAGIVGIIMIIRLFKYKKPVEPAV